MQRKEPRAVRKILIDLLLVALTAGAIWGVVQYRSCSHEPGRIYTPAPADTVYTKGKADTTVTVKKYHHTVRKKKSYSPPAADTVVTESYTAVISLIDGADSLRAEFEVMVKEREVFRVDTISVVKGYECEYWVAGAVLILLVLLAASH